MTPYSVSTHLIILCALCLTNRSISNHFEIAVNNSTNATVTKTNHSINIDVTVALKNNSFNTTLGHSTNETSSNYTKILQPSVSPSTSPTPNPTSLRPNRTAVLLTGQLRTANISWWSNQLIYDKHLSWFGKQDPPTTAATIIEWLFKPLSHRGGLDVFMYVSAHPDDANYSWDGNPLTFRPKVGDTTACDVFSKNEVFNGTGNNFFCLVEPEVDLYDNWLRNYWIFRSYYYGNGKMSGMLLRQLYDMYKANEACKQYSVTHSIAYGYKARVRPDLALSKEIPSYDKMQMGPKTDGSCSGVIYFSNVYIYCCGNEDTFGIG